MSDSTRVKMPVYLRPSTIRALQVLGDAMGKTPNACATGFLEEAEGSLLQMAKAVRAINRHTLPRRGDRGLKPA